jgi:hypothetical protein
MTKTEHLQFLVLMIPTVIVLLAAAVSMADLALPASPDTYSVTAAATLDTVWDDRPAPN